jgi:adenine-specific DNA-methyltransferase
MEKITQGNSLTQSPDFVQENINLLKSLFPTIVKEGKIDLNELTALLDDNVESEEEYYRFTWAGKSMARQEATKPSTATLRPCVNESKNWDKTQNIFIEGDNLEVLKLLQKSYSNKIKMIYIDPPYNTGKDFVYRDNYIDNLKNYLEITGQLDESGKKLSTNTDSDGRYHSNWLNMIYPRLKLARNLLTKEGAIFISINDNEVHNLRFMLNEIFGEENFVADLIWSNKEGGGSSDTKYFRIKHEHILCYAKSIEFLEIIGTEITNIERYKETDKHVDSRGPYYLQKLGMGSIQYSESLDYPIQMPDGNYIYPKDNNMGKKACWRWSSSKFEWGLKNDFVVLKKDSRNVWTVYTKQYLYCDNEGNLLDRTQRPLGVIDTFSSTQASKQLDSLGLGNYFTYSKPYELVNYLIDRIIKEDGIILDFFAGSGTTAHSVIDLNRKDGGKRKWICVQLPETLEKDSEAYNKGYHYITDIARERISKASDKIINEIREEIKLLRTDIEGEIPLDDILLQIRNLEKSIETLDVGFKVFKLDSSNIKTWDSNPENLEQNLFNSASNIKDNRTEEDILYEILLKYGLDLTIPYENRNVSNSTIYNIGSGSLFICLNDELTTKVAEEIGKWKNEINPATCKVIFKDSGFTDIEKTNSMQILKRYGIEEVNTI